MPLSRRRFLTSAAALSSAAAMPSFFQRVARAAGSTEQPGAAETILVVIQLSGGNDGLNTVVPFADPRYAAARPTLRVAAENVLRIDDEAGFHPALGGFAKLLEQNRLCIVQGVGYPQPNRSHFTSMDIWHKATLLPESEPLGWLGRTSPRLGTGTGALYVGGGETPLALFGATGYAPSLQSLEAYRLRVAPDGDDADKRAVVEGQAAEGNADSELLSFLRSSARTTYESAARVQQAATEYDTPVSYPETPLAQRLKLIAQFISAGVPERVYYTALGGFDTHAGQGPSHAELLTTLGSAVAAFHEDLEHQGQHRRVATVMFSEFGRRVSENGSAGTDHGTAAPLFIAGDHVISGLLGKQPGLEDLEEGDLKFHTDFRSVYTTLLEDWLNIPSAGIISGEFPRLKLFA